MTLPPRIALVLILVASTAHADELVGNPNDPGRITHIGRGVWEIDLAALGVLTFDQQGDTSVTRMSSAMSGGLSYFIKDNVSIGAEALVNYDSDGNGTSATTFGGALDAAIHLRLGLGAFFRPGISLGGVYGYRNITVMTGTVMQATQVGLVSRLRFPLAYFASPRFLLEAGPEINIVLGSYTPDGGTSQSFTRVAGGFAVGVGYAF